MSTYQANPENARTPLTSAEAEMLLAEGPKPLARSEATLLHLLERLPITFRAQRDVVAGLSSQIDAARRTQQLGRASTLSPRDAVRFLAAADIDALLASRLEVHTGPLMAVIETLQAELAELRAGARRQGQ